MMPDQIEPAIRALAEKVISGGGSKRAADVLKVMLDKGSISTDEINALGYNHPPRAIGDVRDAGIPVVTGKGTSRSGQRMAVYSLGVAADIQEGRVFARTSRRQGKIRRSLYVRHFDTKQGQSHKPATYAGEVGCHARAFSSSHVTEWGVDGREAWPRPTGFEIALIVLLHRRHGRAVQLR